MSIWYQVRSYGNKITEVEVVRSTEHSVFINEGGRRGERREGRRTSYASYFETHDEAVAFLRERVARRIEYLRRELAELEAVIAKELK